MTAVIIRLSAVQCLASNERRTIVVDKISRTATMIHNTSTLEVLFTFTHGCRRTYAGMIDTRCLHAISRHSDNSLLRNQGKHIFISVSQLIID